MTLGSPADRVIGVIGMAQRGDFEEIRGLFAEPLRPMVSAEALRAAWDAASNRLGAVTSIGPPVTEAGPQMMSTVKVPLVCERGAMALVASISAAGELTGLQLAPPEAAAPTAPWEPPEYADTQRFGEEEITVGSGALAVPGTLSIPNEPRPCPSVVLLAGSGPNDRDETIGRNKPLKDVAWGLASRGIGVLRFDKVTFARPALVQAENNFTVVDEYLRHAVAAVSILCAHPAVEREGIFVVGHSLGGTVAPRVAAAEPGIAGLVLLAAGTEPLQWAAVRQVRYLASLDPATATAADSVIKTMTEQARRVDSPDLSPTTSSSELPFGVPAPYWLDLRAYQPATVAASLDIPMLFAQGGRDYQVTVDGDLATWQRALANRPDVTVRIYPADNHFFFPGSGPSTAAESEPAQHVDATVIADIADWITGHAQVIVRGG
ncbi:MAG TPA: alpha/beta fold hydrolase [Acidimicrobiales bacterium]|nr:alpha/beta fold hydrolase [Acidimicrobiales bacterium]